MAKKLKKVLEEYYKDKEEKVVMTSSSYNYEVEIYVMIPRMYYLFDTINVSLKEYKKEGNNYSRKDGKIIVQCFTLLSAPKAWLEDNKYTKV